MYKCKKYQWKHNTNHTLHSHANWSDQDCEVHWGLLRICKYKCKFIVKNRESSCNHPSQRLAIKCLTIFQIELELENIGFWGEGTTGVPGDKPLEARKWTDKFNPHMMPCPGIKPGTHWWEASALTTALSLRIIKAWTGFEPVEGEEYKWIYESSNIWTAKNDMTTWLIIAVIHTI